MRINIGLYDGVFLYRRQLIVFAALVREELSMPDIFSKITFHMGSVYEESYVTKAIEYGGALLVITAVTPFHPRDYTWPDQPADRGIGIDAAGGRSVLRDTVFVAMDGKGGIFADRDIPVKTGEPGWSFCVGHVFDRDAGFCEGDNIRLEVERDYRKKLSRVHSATHVMSLALNRALASFWSKEAPLFDALGSPDFDGLAMERSAVGESFCTDQYRLGRSLRKKGFSVRELGAGLKTSESEVNRLFSEWLSADAPVTMLATGETLASRRSWRTKIGGLTVEMPCGGTHVSSLAEIGPASAAMAMPDEETLVIITSVR